ncbi:hypothetical protein [Chryseobacterium sp. ERMR1:04]|uniref:hypothetical protein n=1 Tax=Chryseobacterium sp. ERMR1:04 TaxID=1705393 RepID=UPI0006C8859A|nr:hypothetical protein [Chryseobacterium sp. ERMR1:04]
MKKNTFILLAMLSSGFAYSQVGVNTPDPKATFDIIAKNSTGTTTSAEGILIPRVDRQRAQSMTNVETSTLIYVNTSSTGDQTGTAINIDAPGYYYYDGSVWIKLNAAGASQDTNIYNQDGALSENRTVSQADKTLAFTGTIANLFSVDGSTFSVDAANHRVGIGTTTPTNKLVIKGVNAQPDYKNATLRIDGSSNHALDFGTFADSPYGSYISSNDKSDESLPLILNPLGSNVGIGTINPTSSAILELAATDKGFLPPRLTTAQRDAINPKPEGLMIYNATVNIMQYWNGSTWVNYQ